MKLFYVVVVVLSAISSVLCAVHSEHQPQPQQPVETWGSRIRRQCQNNPQLVHVKGNTNEQIVAFTFSDLTEGGLLSSVLGVLEKYKVHATFFIDGNKIERLSDDIKKIVDAGHEVGFQGWSHQDLPSMIDREAQKVANNEAEHETAITEDHVKEALETVWKQEFIQAQALLQSQIVPHDVIFFRPPGGVMPDAFLPWCAELNCHIIIWSIDPQDWKSDLDVDTIVQRVLHGDEQVTPGIHPGAIILMHLHERHKDRTVEVLEQVIPLLHASGFTLVGLSHLLGLSKDVHLKVPENSPALTPRQRTDVQ